MNVLYVTHEFPFPPSAGHHLRILEIIAALPRGARVHLVGYSETDPGTLPASLPGITGFDVIPALVRIRKRPRALVSALARAVLSRRPYSVAKFPRPAMQSSLRRYCRDARPDVIITSLFTQHMVPLGPWKIILDVHNVEHALWQDFVPYLSIAKATFVRREARLLKLVERAAWDAADGIVAISAEDAAAIAEISPGTPVRHVPVRISATSPDLEDPGSLEEVDIGMIGVWSWAPNAIAVDRFAKDVVPGLIQAGLRVRIAGRGLDPKVRARLTRLGVDCPGHVPQLSDFYRSVRVIAAPYTLGGGVRMKVAEALGRQRPVIGTAMAFQGIGPGVPSDWITQDVCEMTAALIKHAANPPSVPAALADVRGYHRQHEALSALFVAAGVTIQDPADPGSRPLPSGTKSTLFT